MLINIDKETQTLVSLLFFQVKVHPNKNENSVSVYSPIDDLSEVEIDFHCMNISSFSKYSLLYTKNSHKVLK